MTTDTDQATKAPAGGRRPLLRVASMLLLLLVGVLFLFHALGASTAVTVLVVGVLVVIALLILRFLPQLRRHFNANRRAVRRTRRSSRTRTVRSSRPARRSGRSTSGRGGRRHSPNARRRGAGGPGSSARRRGRGAGGPNRRRARPPSSASSRRRSRGPGGGSASRRRRTGQPGGPTRRRRNGRTNTNGRGRSRTNQNNRRRPFGRPGRSPGRRPPGAPRTPQQRRRSLLKPWTWRPRRPGRSPGGPKPTANRRRRLSSWATAPARRARQFMQRRRRSRSVSGHGVKRRGLIGMLTRRRSGTPRRGLFGGLARRRQQRRAKNIGQRTRRQIGRRMRQRVAPWMRRATTAQRQRWSKQRKRFAGWRKRFARKRKPNAGGAIPVPRPAQPKQPTPTTAPASNGHRPVPPAVFKRYTPPPPGAGAMSHPIVDAITDVLSEHLGRYEPQGPIEWADFMAALPELFTTLGDEWGRLGDKLTSEFPMAGMPSGEMWGDMTGTTRGLADHAEELHQQFERDFELELRRAREPRPGEPVLDVQNDQ